jgi:hypothetical protein
MKSFVVRVDSRDSHILSEIYAWMGEYVKDHWAVTRLNADAVLIEFFGVDQEQEMEVFRLKFGT